MKVGDLVKVGVNEAYKRDDNIFGVVLEDCKAKIHTNGMHLVQVLHEGFAKWWPIGYIRRINSDDIMD